MFHQLGNRGPLASTSHRREEKGKRLSALRPYAGRDEKKKPKGYGKEKEVPETSASPLISGPSGKKPASPPDRRIVDTSRLSLKTQLKLLRAVKESQQRPASPAPRTKFSRDKEEVIEERDRRIREAEEAAKTVGKYSLASLYGSKKGTDPAVLIVDGYNVIGYDRKLAKLKEANQLDAARLSLEEMLISWSNTRGVRTVIVYDASFSGRTEEEYTTTETGIEIVFTPAMDADTWITSSIRKFYDLGAAKVVVVTGDALLQELSFGHSALIMSCRILLEDMKMAKQELARKSRSAPEGVLAGKRLSAGLSGDVLSKLQALRMQGVEGPKRP